MQVINQTDRSTDHISAAPVAGRRCRIGISTILDGLLTGVILFLVEVPARIDRSLGIGRFLHGWPWTYCERVAFNSLFKEAAAFFTLDEHVITWSPLACAGDLLCCAGIIAVVVVAWEQRRRRARRWISISLRSSFVGITIACVLAFYLGRSIDVGHRLRAIDWLPWRSGSEVTFHSAFEFVGPAWLDRLLRRNALNVVEGDFYPHCVLMKSRTYLQVPADPIAGDSRLAQARALGGALDKVELVFGPDIAAYDSEQQFAGREYRGFKHLETTKVAPPLPQLLACLEDLETLDLRIEFYLHEQNAIDEVEGPRVLKALESLARPERLRRLSVQTVDLAGDAVLEPVERFQSLESLELLHVGTGTVATDGLKRLVRLNRLQMLGISTANRSGERLYLDDSIAKLSQLRILVLTGFQLDGDDLKTLRRLKRLRILRLSRCQLSARGLQELESLDQLSCLNLDEVKVDGTPCTAAQFHELNWRFQGTVSLETLRD